MRKTLLNLKKIWDYRQLISIWAKYNIEGRYIESKLGLLWMVIQPIAMTAVYTFAFSGILLARPPRGDVPFAAFYITGIIIWQLVNVSIVQSNTIIKAKINLIRDINFPRAVIIFVQQLENAVEFLVGLVIMAAVMLIFGINPTWNYLYVPLLAVLLFLFTSGIMFFIGSISVFVRDIAQFTNVIARMLFFISGVIFSIDMMPEVVRNYIYLNPIAIYIETFREVVLYGNPPSMFNLGYLSIVGVLTFILGFLYFQKKERSFGDYI